MNRTTKSLIQTTRHQFRELYRNKLALFFNLLFPLVLVAIFGSMFGTSESAERTPVGVANRDGGPIGAEIEEALSDSGLYSIVPGPEDALENRLRNGDVGAVLIVPEGLSARVQSAELPGLVRIVYDPSSMTSSRVAAELRQLIAGLGAAIQGTTPALSGRLEALAEFAELSAFDYLMPGQTAVMLLSAGLVTVGIAIAAQRQAGVMRHLFSTPLSIIVWTSARIIANLVMAGIQTVILFLFAGLVFDVSPPANMAGTAVVIAVSTLASVGMGLVLGMLVKGEEAAVTVSIPLFMVLLFFGNAMMPLENLPPFIDVIVPFVPSYYMTEALRAVMMHGHSLATVTTELAVLSATAAVLLSLALWRMRRQYVLT